MGRGQRNFPCQRLESAHITPRSDRNPGGVNFGKAAVAQLDRAPDYGSGGLGFESLQLRHRPRGVAQLGSARRSGRRGRRFESCHPDHFCEAGVLAGKGRDENLGRLPRRNSDRKRVNVENESAESATQESFNPVTARAAPPDHFEENGASAF